VNVEAEATKMTTTTTTTTTITTSTTTATTTTTTTTATTTTTTTTDAAAMPTAPKEKQLTKAQKEEQKEKDYGTVVEICPDGKVKVRFRDGTETYVENTALTVRQSYDMNPSEKLEYSKQMKDTGNQQFTKKNFRRAIQYYKTGETSINSEYGLTKEQKELFRTSKAAIRTNIALMHLKLKEYSECAVVCNKVLKDNPHNMKARKRRALANFEGQIGDMDEIKKDFVAVLAQNPKDIAVKKRLDNVKKKIKKQQKEQKKIYKRMFQPKPKSNRKTNQNTEKEITKKYKK